MASFPTVDFSQYQWVVNDTNYLTKHNNLMTALVTMQNNINKFGAESKSESDSAIGIAQSLIEAYSVNVLAPYKDKATLLSDFANQRFRLYDGLRINDIADTSLWTIERATIGTYVDATGNIRTAPINEPRYTYDPETGEALGVLIEPNRTNKVLHSEDLTNAAWFNFGSFASVSLTSKSSPIDGVNFSRIEASATNASTTLLLTQTLSSAVGSNISFSFYVSKNFNNLAYVQVDTGANTRSLINLSTGLVEIQHLSVSRLDVGDFGDAWEISGTFQAQDTTTRFGVMPRRTNSIGYNDSYSSGDYADFTGFQFEDGSYSSSYIATTSAPVARAKDTIYRAMSDEIRPREFSVYLDIDLRSVSETLDYLFFINGALSTALSPWFGLRWFGNSIRLTTSGVGDICRFFDVPLGRHKIGVSVKNNVFVLSLDGESVTEVSQPLDNYDFSFYKQGRATTTTSQNHTESVRDLFMIPIGLTAAELNALTAGGQS
ncbi:phage head spike fiber domain-containing protein [Vreelandella venusta]|uniref:phage head spike fiber domain-containing protein n=1 Tax=Vreelandella venusta TaxID=44935 RepID=UPI003F66C03F